MKYNFAEYEKKLKKYLDKDRYRHTLGVMYTAAALAMAHEYDMEQAQMAGLLHDCAKCIPNKKKLKICRKQNIRISSVEQANPFLLHAKLGAYIAEKKYQVEDEEILSAIRWHTTGKEAMSDLEKIVYIADYIEPNRREIPGLGEIRGIVFQDIDRAVCLSAERTVSYLKDGGNAVDPMTVSTYEYYKK